jgi:hypothetical protein
MEILSYFQTRDAITITVEMHPRWRGVSTNPVRREGDDFSEAYLRDIET